MSALRVSGPDGMPVGVWADTVPVGPGADAATLRLARPEAPDVVTDTLGIPAGGLTRLPPVVTDLQFRLELVAPDCPLGPLRTTIVVGGDGHVVSTSWGEAAGAGDRSAFTIERHPLSITGPYLLLLAWLHRDVIFGNLIWAGADLQGDLLDFAALDGLVSAPPGPRPETEVVDTLIELSAQAVG